MLTIMPRRGSGHDGALRSTGRESVGFYAMPTPVPPGDHHLDVVDLYIEGLLDG